MSLHTATFRGRKVRVVLKSGEVIIDKFLDRAPGSRWIQLKHHRVLKADIKCFSDYRPEAK